MRNNTDNNSMDRREFLTGVGATLTAGIAGCADNNNLNSEPDNQNNTSSTSEEQPEPEDKGLDIDATWSDIEDAEIEAYEGTPLFNEALNGMDKSFIRNSDLTNPDEFQEAISNSVYNTVEETLGESRSQASSALMRSGAAAVNYVLQQEIQENPDYTDFNAKVINGGVSGHGFGYAVSTESPIIVVDSNTRYSGTVDEEPLQNRNDNIKEPLAEFIDKEFEEVEDSNKSTYRGFPKSIYSMEGDGKLYVAIDPDVIDEYYDKAIFADDCELWLGPVRDAVGTLSYMVEEDYFEPSEAVSLTISPEDLPHTDDFEEFDQYAAELLEGVEEYDSVDNFRQEALQP